MILHELIRATAIHEAGHAVVALALGVEVLGAELYQDEIKKSLNPNRDMSKRITVGGTWIKKSTSSPCQHAIIDRAGMIAELRMYPKVFKLRCIREDLRRAREADSLCTEHSPTYHREQAKKIVYSKSSTIIRIAEAIITGKCLSGPELVVLWR